MIQEHKNTRTQEHQILTYKDQVKSKLDQFVQDVYRFSKQFPKEELYGVTSQLRRAALSVVLNYIEGFARRRPLVQLNFLEISYGSLQESKYLLEFALKVCYLKQSEFDRAHTQADEIGAMLWSEIQALDKSVHG